MRQTCYGLCIPLEHLVNAMPAVALHITDLEKGKLEYCLFENYLSFKITIAREAENLDLIIKLVKSDTVLRRVATAAALLPMSKKWTLKHFTSIGVVKTKTKKICCGKFIKNKAF